MRLNLYLCLLSNFWLVIVISLQLAKHKEALDFAIAAQSLAPSNSEVADRLEHVKRDLAAGL